MKIFILSSKIVFFLLTGINFKSPAEMETAKKVFLFSFIREFTNEEQEKLDSIVRSLGAISKLNEDMYVSDSTHIVVPDCVDQKWCPKLFGGLASGKEVVTGSYLFKSMKARKFLNEADFRPKYVKHIIDHVERYDLTYFDAVLTYRKYF